MAQPPSDFDHRPPPGTSAANAPRPHGGRQGLREATLPWPGAEPLPAPFPWLGGFLHGRPYLAERLATLATLIAAERGPGRLLPWLAIAFGAGIAVYFTATHEPVWWVAALTALVLCGIAYRVRAHARVFAATALGAAMLCGFAIASIKAVLVAHPVLTRTAYSVSLKGFVEGREVRETSDRIVVRVTDMSAIRGTEKLTRVRLSVRKKETPTVGAHIELKARLMPPPQPQRPGGYDFARDLYFQGIGATGFALGHIKETAPDAAQGGWRLRIASALQNIRDGVDARIAQVMQGDTRAIASALLTGRRDAITTPVNDAMFISGLGHVLSISGYHMAVVAGIVFFVLRALAALIAPFNARYHAKKWVAGAALLAATFYLALSGAEVATQRSYFMTAIVLIGVMVDRRAITLRTLTIAAFAVLLLAPEAVVHPSFQMSFAATLGLVALIEHGMPRLFAAHDSGMAARAALWGGREIAVLALASLIAGAATMPYAAFHFHRIAPYGVLANLAAMPVVSGIVMPMGLLGMLAIPFGLDAPCWWLMEGGILWMIAVAQWVAALPGALINIHAFGTGAMALASLGLVMMGLLHTRLRWLGAPVVGIAVIWAGMTPRPDVLIASDGASLALRGKDGDLIALRASRDAFALREWLAADGDPRNPRDAALNAGTACDKSACMAPMRDGAQVALVMKPEALAEECARADLIVSAVAPPRDCRAVVVTRAQLEIVGALALRRLIPDARRASSADQSRVQNDSRDAAHAARPNVSLDGDGVHARAASQERRGDDAARVHAGMQERRGDDSIHNRGFDGATGRRAFAVMAAARGAGLERPWTPRPSGATGGNPADPFTMQLSTPGALLTSRDAQTVRAPIDDEGQDRDRWGTGGAGEADDGSAGLDDAPARSGDIPAGSSDAVTRPSRGRSNMRSNAPSRGSMGSTMTPDDGAVRSEDFGRRPQSSGSNSRNGGSVGRDTHNTRNDATYGSNRSVNHGFKSLYDSAGDESAPQSPSEQDE